jgi:hypothetical protein
MSDLSSKNFFPQVLKQNAEVGVSICGGGHHFVLPWYGEQLQ